MRSRPERSGRLFLFSASQQRFLQTTNHSRNRYLTYSHLVFSIPETGVVRTVAVSLYCLESWWALGASTISHSGNDKSCSQGTWERADKEVFSHTAESSFFVDQKRQTRASLSKKGRRCAVLGLSGSSVQARRSADCPTAL